MSDPATGILSPPPLDPVFHLPMPPSLAVFNTTANNYFCVIYGIGVVAVLLWALLRDRNPVIVLALFLGAAGVSVFEPLFDLITAVWHPPVGQSPLFISFGRSIPVWLTIAYVAYYGGLGYLLLGAFQRGITRRAIWLWCLIPIAVDELVEEAMLHFNLYYYYAHQPLILIKFPVYQTAGNTSGVFFGITVLYFLAPLLQRGWKWFPAALIVMPVCGTMGFIGACLPAALAINVPGTPYWVTQLAGLACYGLMGAGVYVISLLVAADSPYRYTPGFDAAPVPSRPRRSSVPATSPRLKPR